MSAYHRLELMLRPNPIIYTGQINFHESVRYMGYLFSLMINLEVIYIRDLVQVIMQEGITGGTWFPFSLADTRSE